MPSGICATRLSLSLRTSRKRRPEPGTSARRRPDEGRLVRAARGGPRIVRRRRVAGCKREVLRAGRGTGVDAADAMPADSRPHIEVAGVEVFAGGRDTAGEIGPVTERASGDHMQLRRRQVSSAETGPYRLGLEVGVEAFATVLAPDPRGLEA